MKMLFAFEHDRPFSGWTWRAIFRSWFLSLVSPRLDDWIVSASGTFDFCAACGAMRDWRTIVEQYDRPALAPPESLSPRRRCAKMHNMDWDHVRFFLAVYRSGSSNAAARKLRVQHTTVGRRLAALEATLGERLFIRTPEGLTPTEAAVAIAPSAEEAERCFLAIERQVRRTDSGIEGKVRLTTSEAFGGYLIRHLARLQSRYPNLTVEIDTSNAVRDLARGEADIAVRMMPTVQSELICRRIGEAGWSLFGSADYIARRGLPDLANGLAGHDVIGFGESLAGSPGARWLGANAKGAHVPLRGEFGRRGDQRRLSRNWLGGRAVLSRLYGAELTPSRATGLDRARDLAGLSSRRRAARTGQGGYRLHRRNRRRRPRVPGGGRGSAGRRRVGQVVDHDGFTHQLSGDFQACLLKSSCRQLCVAKGTFLIYLAMSAPPLPKFRSPQPHKRE